MDHHQFDRMAQSLASMTGRRRVAAVIAAALGGAAISRSGMPPGSDPATAASRPNPSGACGPRKKEGNACRADADCCTGYCMRDLKNRDNLGRCRCVRRGGDCSDGQTCCSRLQCIAGVCGLPQPAPTPTAVPSCDAGSCPNGCCQGATCLDGTSVSACGTGGIACADCGQGICLDQTCAPCFNSAGC
jgi:hypothetical protein